MCTIVDDCAQIAESDLKPPFESPHLDFPHFGPSGALKVIFNVQDKLDHDKGQKSAISGRPLHWRLSTGFIGFFSSIYVCNLVRRTP